jgi:uncharacterized protein (DUF1697 family)
MKKYVVLLRGVNVGGNCKVDMKQLKVVFEELGFSNVSTYINSGNVLFQSKNPPSVIAIEKALKKAFGFAIVVVVRTADNIAKVVKAIPAGWDNNSQVRTDVLFLWDEYNNKSSLKLITPHPEADKLQYVDGAILWRVNRKFYTKSAMRKFIGTPLYKHMTARNVNTVAKLAQLLKSDT